MRTVAIFSEIMDGDTALAPNHMIQYMFHLMEVPRKVISSEMIFSIRLFYGRKLMNLVSGKKWPVLRIVAMIEYGT